jgi:3-carboxy-cis,cis-muconate cycloisomerase
MLAGSFAKIGQDVILLTQSEVEEVVEAADGSSGGSSTMPHKANPIGSEMMVVAARATGALQSALQAAAIQEHERSTHGWPLEWLVLPQMIALAYGAAAHAGGVARHLHVDVARMRENIGRAGDVAMAEPIALALAAKIAPEEAHALVRDAAIEARASRESLVAAVRRAAIAKGLDSGIDWDRLADPSAHLGAANAFIDRILDEAKRIVR